MFDICWTELLLIGVVALIVIGPKELPGVLRTLGQWMRKMRSMAAEFQDQFQEAMREAEMADLKKQVDDMAHDIKSYDPLKDVTTDVKRQARISRSARDGAGRAPPSAGIDPADARCRTPPRCADRPDRARARPPVAPEAGASHRPCRHAGAAAAQPRHAGRRRRGRTGRARSPSRSAEPDSGRRRHEPRRRREGHRGHQGAADGAPDRAALAADQGARRVRLTFFVCFFFAKQIYNVLTWPYRLGRGRRRIRSSSTPALLEYFIVQLKLAMFGAAFIVVPGRRRRRSTCSSRPAFTATSGRPSCPISIATPIFFLARRDGRLFPGLADAGALLARHAAARRRRAGDDRAAAEGRATISR